MNRHKNLRPWVFSSSALAEKATIAAARGDRMRFCNSGIEARQRIPGRQHTGNSIGVTIESNFLANAVRAAKHLLIQLIANDNFIAALFVGGLAPSSAEPKRYVQHLKVIDGYGISFGFERIDPRVSRNE